MQQQARINLKPGVNLQLTQTANEGGWWASNLIRWKSGLLEKMGGWLRLLDTPASGYVRAMHAFEDLSLNLNLALGTDGGAEIYTNGAIYPLGFARRVTGLYCSPFDSAVNVMGGSAVVTVTDVGHSAQVGDTVNIGVTLSGGGQVLLPQTVTVASVVDADNWTFVHSSVFSGDVSLGAPVFSVTSGSAVVAVELEGHGFFPGDTFSVQYPVVWLSAVGAASIPAGDYTVIGPVDFTNFNIQIPAVASQSASGAEYGFNPDPPGIFVQPEVPFTYSGSPPPQPENWFLDNLGQNLIISFEDGPLYVWEPPISTTGINSASGIDDAPNINTGMLVAMPQAQVIALGSEAVIGSGVQDPLLLRWSDAGGYSDWIASSTDQAGSYRLSRGSRIIGGIQAPQSTLILTDTDMWAMQYVGPPFVYSFTIVGTGCGLLSAKSIVGLGRSTYWMGDGSFWMFGGSDVTPLDCPVWDYIFNDLDTANQNKCFAAASSSFQEVMFFFPSASGGTGEVDSYVKLNVKDGLWDVGRLGRSAWIDNNVFGPPMGADLNFRIQQHETGYDDDDVAMTGVSAESGYFDLGEGTDILFISQIIPDFKWFGTNGSVSLLVKTVNYPGDTPQFHGPYTITNTTRFIRLRARARQAAVRLEWGESKGFSARWGAFRALMAPSGKRP